MSKAMIARASLAAMMALAGTAAFAQPAPPPPGPPMPPPPPRAIGPMLAPSVVAASKAIEVCRGNGYKVTALVVDLDGVPVAMLSADGVPARTQQVAIGKVTITLKYGVPSGEIADKAKNDPALTATLKSDPRIMFIARGGLPIMAGGKMIGAIAVSGAPGGEKDEVCASAALAAAFQ